MRNIGETIYIPITAQNEVSFANQIGTTKTYWKGYTLGNTVPTGFTGVDALGGMTVPIGTGTNERTGQWTYLKRTSIHMMVDQKPNTGTNDSQPTQYRLIVVKAKPGARQFGQSYTPNSTLFYDTAGQEFGFDTSGVTGNDVMLQPVNTRRWSVYKDMKFTLSPPDQTTGSMNSRYSSRKECRIVLPFWKKVRMNTSSEPQDIDIHYTMFLFANNLAQFTDANRGEISMRGTTTFNDI